MGRVKTNGKVKSLQLKPPKLSVEDRLRTIANFIVDRILEEQRNGKLQLRGD